MSFSTSLKQELVALPLEKTCCMASELGALTACCASISLQGRGRLQMVYTTHSPSVLKRIFTLLKQGYGIGGAPRLSSLSNFGGMKQYQLRLSVEDSRSLMRSLSGDHKGAHHPALYSVPSRIVRRICCRRAWIRGFFLGCGSVLDPRKGYRAEFVMDGAQRADYLVRLLKLGGIEALRSERRGNVIIYIRQGDALFTLFGLMGASRAVMELENIRAENSLRESLNRVANCDTSNFRKQVSAAQQQIEHITRISLLKGLTSLPKHLEELARLRLSHPDLGLKELGELASPPLSKSGVQHRLRRLAQIAQDIQQEN
ncbi:MAG: DNA-binding protein WhiA [Clostridiales bacterium]|nr:DNA-binding protein WhiA [Clostridiales bacterium]